MATKVTFTVSLVLPPEATAAAATTYVREAVRTWRGSLEPLNSDLGDGTFGKGDPMSGLDPDSVKVTLHRQFRGR